MITIYLYFIIYSYIYCFAKINVVVDLERANQHRGFFTGKHIFYQYLGNAKIDVLLKSNKFTLLWLNYIYENI